MITTFCLVLALSQRPSYLYHHNFMRLPTESVTQTKLQMKALRFVTASMVEDFRVARFIQATAWWIARIVKLQGLWKMVSYHDS